MMGTVLKLVAAVAVIGGLGLLAFAYLGDLDPTQERVTEPVELELGR